MKYPPVHINDVPISKMEEKNGWNISEFRLPITGKSGAPYQELALLLKSAGYEAMLTGDGVWNSLDFIVPRIDAIHFENWLSSSLVST